MSMDEITNYDEIKHEIQTQVTHPRCPFSYM